MTRRSPRMLLSPAMTRRKVLGFSVVVLGGLIMLGVGWEVGRQARRACEVMARERQASGGRQSDVQDCVAARLLNGGA